MRSEGISEVLLVNLSLPGFDSIHQLEVPNWYFKISIQGNRPQRYTWSRLASSGEFPLTLQLPRNRLSKLRRRCLPTQVRCANVATFQDRERCVSDTVGDIVFPHPAQHQDTREDDRQRIGDSLARDVWGGAVHRLEDRG